MRSGWLEGRIYGICEWITRLAYVNILWGLFTLVGAIFLGVAPATVALFTVVRKWLLFSDNDVPIFKTFFNTYKKEFLRANKIGLFIGLVSYILYIDFLYIANVREAFQLAFSVFLFVILVFYAITLLYIFPIYVHYELRFLQYIKYSFFIGMANPLMTLTMFLSIFLLTVLFIYIPGLIPFFSVSLVSVVLMWCALRGFRKIEEKQNAIHRSNSKA
ncbi:YesL family protein [Parageobacillus sp. VR-IP]|uniref:YesL family protein n=1 Tax=Parageobacillus sp. VR-IP TaxID=2742205 RepID=UPI001581DD4B|nr:YesL family protein [Parageobacillus sp. VR-IP]NUK30247.1 YesL family protein [Parageobacillus sp. VR-IP]